MERGVLFSAPMVRALLDGRKTMTRRIYKSRLVDNVEASLWSLPSPYGVPGDRLWVRETVLQAGEWVRRSPEDDTWSQWTGSDRLIYGADDLTRHEVSLPKGWKWRVWPSIHMRRVWSRITLDVTAVRVERLHEITEEDARAEGVEPLCEVLGIAGIGGVSGCRGAFFKLWADINGHASLVANPFVWVVSFQLQRSPL